MENLDVTILRGRPFRRTSAHGSRPDAAAGQPGRGGMQARPDDLLACIRYEYDGGYMNNCRLHLRIFVFAIFLLILPSFSVSAITLPAGTKPYEGDGITAAWIADNWLRVVSGDKMWLLDMTDPANMVWVWGHRMSDLDEEFRVITLLPWLQDAPTIGGVDLIEGLTAGWYYKGLQAYINGNRNWVYNRSSANVNDWEYIGASEIGGAPWDTAAAVGGVTPLDGITAGYIVGDYLGVINTDKYWVWKIGGNWVDQGYLENHPGWKNAKYTTGLPNIAPWDDEGVTAAYTWKNPLTAITYLTAVRKDKYWSYNLSTGTWSGGYFKNNTLWKNAPVVRDEICGWKPSDAFLQDFTIFQYNDYYYIAAFWVNSGKKLKYARSQNLQDWEELGTVLDVGGYYDPDRDSVGACHVIKHGSDYYLYYTATRSYGGEKWEQSIMAAKTAKPSDPASWTKVDFAGTTDGAFRPTHAGAQWIAGGWAACRDPMVYYYNNKFYMYYTGEDKVNGTIKGIVGCAEASSPLGPWTDLGAVLTTAGNPESAFLQKAADGKYILTYNIPGFGCQYAVSSSPKNQFAPVKKYGPGWAHEWITIDNKLYSLFLTGRWVNISTARWVNGHDIQID